MTATALMRMNMCLVTSKPSCNIISVELRGYEGYLYIFFSVIIRNGIFQTRQLRTYNQLVSEAM